ncbi:hypothetical protein LWP59_36805 [Amycolatopsis acidiphila]|uniref:YggT family protein n=1 Tax=Amycolatopsis acidiphila TaxID=715473 RepID=A0A557ZTQ5_9PSEU|nr:hypothetical protein [Amycolatopsis acidiphila]TVT15406.1 hypothetical protein FNH06_36195 [Amycolatopsis acidiphila]UIJ59528.1 hypothetical protein LWP59_36805 [Amycolatopsis acidiphila]GHG80441.1 hypothetical protein GCM10017788_49420 [Amycolatopsis acidiphila]
MAEHAERSDNDVADEESRPKRGSDVDWHRIKDSGVGLVAGVVRWVGLVFAVILVLHVIFTVGSANPANGIVSWVRGWADSLSIGFKDLFEPNDAKLRVLVNYGIAALFWLIVSAIVAKLIRRIFAASN